MTVILFTRNLMTNASVGPAAAAAGLALKTLRDPEQLTAELVAEHPVQCVLLDLAEAELSPAAVMQRLEALQITPLVVAFGPHVDTQRLNEASEAGCHHVISRGQLAGALPQLLAAR